jgi:hypothetical protein
VECHEVVVWKPRIEMEFAMNKKEYINPGKEVTREIAVGWSMGSKALYACFRDEIPDTIQPYVRNGRYVCTIRHLDDLLVVISSWGTISEASLQSLKKACADVPLPAPLYWLLK